MDPASAKILFASGVRADQLPFVNDPRKITISEYSEQEISNTIRLLVASNKSLQLKIEVLEKLKDLRLKNETLNKKFDELAKEAQENPNIIYK